MSIDALITNPGRLRILTALANEPRQEFVRLRGATQMTDGNLATHARRLHSAGLVDIDKTFRDGKPVTTIILTDEGRGALHHHVENLMRVLRIGVADDADTPAPEVSAEESPANFVSIPDDSDWID